MACLRPRLCCTARCTCCFVARPLPVRLRLISVGLTCRYSIARLGSGNGDCAFNLTQLYCCAWILAQHIDIFNRYDIRLPLHDEFAHRTIDFMQAHFRRRAGSGCYGAPVAQITAVLQAADNGKPGGSKARINAKAVICIAFSCFVCATCGVRTGQCLFLLKISYHSTEVFKIIKISLIPARKTAVSEGTSKFLYIDLSRRIR